MKRSSHQRAVLVLASCIVALASGVAHARESAPDDYRRLNLALVDNHVIPRYAALAESAALLDRRATAYCAEASGTAYDALLSAWAESTNAWQGVQHIRFGPVELFMRGMRMSFWPDPRNTVGRQLDELVAARDGSVLAPKAFARSTISIQGFPALERLIPQLGEQAGGTSDERTFRCAVLRAVTRNLAGMAADVLHEWRAGDRPYRAVVGDAAPPGGHYALDREATQDLFKSLHASLELLAEHKLLRPLGPSIQAARPQLAESWRSGRSLDNIRINLATAEALYLGDGGEGFSAFVRDQAGDTALDDLFRRAFAQTRASAEAVALPLEKAVTDPVERKKVEKLAIEVGALKTLVAQRLTVALGIPLGFNSLDGD